MQRESDRFKVTFTIIAFKLKMFNQDRIIFSDFSVNFKLISLKFFRIHFLLKF